MLWALAVAALCLAVANGQRQTSNIDPGDIGRCQLYVGFDGLDIGEKRLLRLDTRTGKTWRLSAVKTASSVAAEPHWWEVKGDALRESSQESRKCGARQEQPTYRVKTE